MLVWMLVHKQANLQLATPCWFLVSRPIGDMVGLASTTGSEAVDCHNCIADPNVNPTSRCNTVICAVNAFADHVLEMTGAYEGP